MPFLTSRERESACRTSQNPDWRSSHQWNLQQTADFTSICPRRKRLGMDHSSLVGNVHIGSQQSLLSTNHICPKTSRPKTLLMIFLVSQSVSGWMRATWSLVQMTFPRAERDSLPQDCSPKINYAWDSKAEQRVTAIINLNSPPPWWSLVFFIIPCGGRYEGSGRNQKGEDSV